MIFEEKKLAESVGCHINTMRKYLARYEFAHIKKNIIERCKQHPRIWIYNNVEEQDIDRLKELVKWKIKKQKTLAS